MTEVPMTIVARADIEPTDFASLLTCVKESADTITMADEPLRRAEERSVKSGLADGVDFASLSEVDLVGCHQANACVVIVLAIPGCEPSAERACRVDGLAPFWGIRADTSAS